MACQPNQLGSIVSTSRETLDEGKVSVLPLSVDDNESQTRQKSAVKHGAFIKKDAKLGAFSMRS